MPNPIAEPQVDASGNPVVEKLPDDISIVREKMTGSDDKEFLKMMGLNKEHAETTEETDAAVAETVEELVEEPESRETRTRKALEYKQGKKKVEVPQEQEEEAPVAEVVAPEAPVAEEKPAEEEKPLLTQFSMKQGAEEVEIPRDLTFSFKANKKDYVDVPADKVVLLAQMGVYNEAREQEVTMAKKYVGEVVNVNKSQAQVIEALKKEFDDLLGDEAYREVAVQEYNKRNTPEARAQKAEAELVNQRRMEQAAEQTRQGQAYIRDAILPAIEKLGQAFPSVSEDEVMGRFNRLITPYVVNGVVPLHNLPTVKQLVEVDMTNWAQAVSVERDTARKKQETVVENKVKAAKVQTTLAKRELARVTKPTGGVPAGIKEKPKPKQYKSADDWARTAVDELVNNLR